MTSFGDIYNMSSPSRSRQSQGPRPAPLTVSRSSAKIMKKPPQPNQSRAPVIVYLESPKVIHVRPEEFMGLVQRLTGKQAASSSVVASSSSSSSGLMVHANNHESTNNGVEYVTDSALGVPPMASDFVPYPSFFFNV